MATLTTAHVLTRLTPPDPPCVSLYLPTHRAEPGRREDPIRFKNLVHRAEESLRQKYPGGRVQEVVRKFDALAADAAFWATQMDGLGILCGGDVFEVYRLPRPVKELAVVANSFHVKPLLRITQGADRFQVLCLSRTEAGLYEGDRYGLAQIPDALPTFTEAVGDELYELQGSQRSRITRGGRSPSTGHYSGHGGRKDELDADQFKFIREIDRAVTEISERSGLPLVVVGLDDNLGEFKKKTQNRFVAEPMVSGDPGSFTPDGLREAAWKVIEPRFRARVDELKEAYGTASARKMASADASDIAAAALDGRVGTLLVDADKVVPGRVDPQARSVTHGKMDDPDTDDLLDDLAELTLKTGGRVVVLPSDQMPTDTGLAAVFRF